MQKYKDEPLVKLSEIIYFYKVVSDMDTGSFASHFCHTTRFNANTQFRPAWALGTHDCIYFLRHFCIQVFLQLLRIFSNPAPRAPQKKISTSSIPTLFGARSLLRTPWHTYTLPSYINVTTNRPIPAHPVPPLLAHLAHPCDDYLPVPSIPLCPPCVYALLVSRSGTLSA